MKVPRTAAVAATFGQLLRRYRLAVGLTQEALADAAGLSVNGISALERGYRRAPHFATLRRLLDVLDLDRPDREAFLLSARTDLGADGSISQLPFALTPFMGREVERAEILTLLREYRLVTLTGAGGIGKTQTALQIARDLADTLTDSVAFVGLTSATDSRVFAAVAEALGVRDLPGRPMIDVVTAHLRAASLMLILDNCEHVIEKAATIATSILRSCPRIRILATSREPLQVVGERRYRLPGLSIPTALPAETVTVSDCQTHAATALFIDRACAVAPRFKITTENAATIATICRRLSGIPLAIELAAARVNVLSLESIAEGLHDCLQVLTRSGYGVLPRQQTMRATIDWSYDLLEPRERSVFESLSICGGSATLDAVAQICDEREPAETLEVLASLVDKSMAAADVERAEPRYFHLEPFRQYGREKLQMRGGYERTARLHLRWSVTLAEEIERRRRRGRRLCIAALQPVDVRRLRDEVDNWRTALQWSLAERGDPLMGQRLLLALLSGWLDQTDYGEEIFGHAERRRWVDLALNCVEENTPKHIVANLEYLGALISHKGCEYSAQLASSQRAANHFRASGDEPGLVRALGIVGHALAHLGRPREALNVFQEVLPLARRLPDTIRLAFVLRATATVYSLTGQLSKAGACLRECLAIYESEDARKLVPYAHDDLGELAFYGGDTQSALDHAARMLTAARAIDNCDAIALALNGMTVYLITLGRFGEAVTHARESLEFARRHNLDVMTAWSLHHLAVISILRDEPTSGAARPRAAARLLGYVEARLAQLGSAHLHTHQKQRDRAHLLLQRRLGRRAVSDLLKGGSKMTEEAASEDEALLFSVDDDTVGIIQSRFRAGNRLDR